MSDEQQTPLLQYQLEELTHAMIALAFKWEREDMPGAFTYRSATLCAQELRETLATHRVPLSARTT